ncbi:MAG TPA: right-handed parallel beta-helix repeat-containing protein, partial [Chitinophagaceae bacterium]
MKKIFFLSLFMFSLLDSFSQQRTVFYVSLLGKDNNPGTIQRPFATLEKARSVVRVRSKQNHSDSVIVYLRKGNYTLKKSFSLDSLDSGKENAAVIYSAYPGEEVHINGSISIPVNRVKPVFDPLIVSRLVPEAKDKIVQVDLKKAGLNDFGKIKPKGFGRPYEPTGMELFCNNTAMKLSRWPNDSLVKTGKVLDPGSVPRNGDFSNRGGKFMFDQLRPQRWSAAKDIWISGFFKYGYADDAVKIANLDLLNKTITTEQPHIYGFENGKIFHKWYAFNLLEEIDQPGEYYIDRENGILYFYPPTEQLTSIELSVLETPLVTMMNVSNVKFRNIIFEGSRGIGLYIERGSSNTIENCEFRNLGLVGIMIGKGIRPYKNIQHAGTGEPASAVIGSLYSHLYDNTAMDREAG